MCPFYPSSSPIVRGLPLSGRDPLGMMGHTRTDHCHLLRGSTVVFLSDSSSRVLARGLTHSRVKSGTFLHIEL